MVDKNYTSLSNESLAEEYIKHQNISRKASESLREVKIEILKRIADSGTEGLSAIGYDISKKHSVYEYNIDNLYAQLGEIISPDELDKLFTTIPSKVKVDGRVARSLISKYKGKVQDIIEKNRDSINPVLKVESNK